LVGVQAIVGLGNPGPRYDGTRHNVGFWFVDALAGEAGERFAAERKLHGEVARVRLGGTDVRLIKPATYVNRSGQCVRALCDYFQLPVGSVLVVHDDLDLPPGTVKLKHGGGHGGHNGLRDTIAHLGADFPRLRVGIGHPGQREEVVNYVLGSPGRDDEQLIREALARAAQVVPVLLERGMEPAMQLLHSSQPSAGGA